MHPPCFHMDKQQYVLGCSQGEKNLLDYFPPILLLALVLGRLLMVPVGVTAEVLTTAWPPSSPLPRLVSPCLWRRTAHATVQ